MAAVLLPSWDSSAEQFVLFDRMVTNTGGRRLYSDWDFVTRLPHQPGAPKNWLTPISYADGNYHLRVEVLEMKGISKPVDFCLGCWNKAGDPTIQHCCWWINSRIKAPGVYEQEKRIRSFWHGPGKGSKRLPWDFASAYKDRSFFTIIRPHGQDPFPVKMHVTMTVVSEGSTYNPYWETGGVRYKDLVELKNVAACIERGRLGMALAAARKRLGSENPAEAAEARKVVEALEKHAKERRGSLEAKKAEDPVYAVRALAELAQRYRLSQTGRGLAARAAAWSKEPATKRAYMANLTWEAAQSAARKIRKEGKASDPKFARRYGHELLVIGRVALKLKRAYPETESCRKALALAERFGIEIPD